MKHTGKIQSLHIKSCLNHYTEEFFPSSFLSYYYFFLLFFLPKCLQYSHFDDQLYNN